MAFLDKLGSLAKNLGDKTNEAIAMSKLNGKITSEKALAETELRKIGEYYYGQFLSGGQIEPEILEACQSAKAHYRKSHGWFPSSFSPGTSASSGLRFIIA